MKRLAVTHRKYKFVYAEALVKNKAKFTLQSYFIIADAGKYDTYNAQHVKFTNI